MNIKNKIVSMGFRKCQFHRMEHEPLKDALSYRKYFMVPDIYSRDSRWDKDLKKWISTETKVKHPKWSKFYLKEINRGIKIWILVERDNIKKIWLESIDLKEGVKIIYNNSTYKNTLINGKRDIINLFPKGIKRDFIIKDILG